MTYDEAIEWLLSFADFERSGRFQDRPDVAPMLALLERLGNPHLGRTTVHIAGSKGKGSVAAMVESILRAADRTTGLYTSPHLYDYTERIAVDGAPIARAEFARLATQVRPVVQEETNALGDRKFVTFDLLTALGFMAFRDADVSAQVVEVGLGGRVDSTNVFEAKDVAVITPVSLEHTRILGDTVDKIALEKVAIVTRDSIAVMAPQEHPMVSQIVQDQGSQFGIRIVDVARDYRWWKHSHNMTGQYIQIGDVVTRIPLLGTHQIENAATAVASIHALNADRQTEFVRTDAISRGLANVRWPCRIEVLREDPLVIADGAHNRDSARRLAETLVEYFACDRALFVIGCGSDKDIDGLAEELAPLASRVLAVRSEHPRAMDPKRIVEAFGRLNVNSEIVGRVPDAVNAAIAEAGPRALICVAGSLFVAAEARAHVLGVRT